ncbi:hypothetical protein MMC30_008944 [Trapelia coarctata]|nr:hypothetical protein [Trapelia coarctata]
MARPYVLDQDPKPRVIFVIGVPGTGKETLCSRLAVQTRVAHISYSQDLRDLPAVEKRITQDYLKKHLLVPNRFSIPMLRDHIMEEGCRGKSWFLLDGFPRHVLQLKGFEEQGKCSIIGAVHLVCPQKVSRWRVENRPARVLDDEDHDRVQKHYEEIYERQMSDIVPGPEHLDWLIDYLQQRTTVKVLDTEPAVDEVYESFERMIYDFVRVEDHDALESLGF